jgi:hypothetical protein
MIACYIPALSERNRRMVPFPKSALQGGALESAALSMNQSIWDKLEQRLGRLHAKQRLVLMKIK